MADSIWTGQEFCSSRLLGIAHGQESDLAMRLRAQASRRSAAKMLQSPQFLPQLSSLGSELKSGLGKQLEHARPDWILI